jgi:predicted transcriptional regulator
VSNKPKVEEIFSALGDDISLRLFRLASIGIDPTAEFMQKTGLTRKQFYTRLQKFVKLGLVQKKQGLYTLTTLGTVVQNIQLKPLEEIVDNYWKLQAIEMLKDANKIPAEERNMLIESIAKSEEFNLLSYVNPGKIKIINNWEELLKRLSEFIQAAKKEIYIGSRYHDPVIAKNILDKFQEGVSLYMLDSSPDSMKFSNELRAILLSPPDKQTYDFCVAVLNSDKVQLRNKSLPFSFIVVDGTFAGFEIMNPLSPNEFLFAVDVKDEKISQKLIAYFNELWKTAEETGLKQLVGTKSTLFDAQSNL